MAQTKNRAELHEILCSVLGSRNCYYSPPSSIRMKYPCIRYELAGIRGDFADNIAYKNSKRYTLTVIDDDPDSEIPNKLLDLPYCVFDRAYTADNLNHFVLTLYY